MKPRPRDRGARNGRRKSKRDAIVIRKAESPHGPAIDNRIGEALGLLYTLPETQCRRHIRVGQP